MKRLLAAILICAVAPFVAAQTSSAEPQSRGYRGRGYRGQQWKGRPDNGWGNFWGGVLGGYLAGRAQSERPGREGSDVEGDLELVPWSKEWFAFCVKRYKSFDTETGTYLSYDGNRYFCK
jgi:hypothetical protein